MSTETRREIKIIPAQAVLVERVSFVYACRRCEREEITTLLNHRPDADADAASTGQFGFTFGYRPHHD